MHQTQTGDAIMNRCVRPVLALALFALVTYLSACNTTKGFGEDVQQAGNGIKNSAEKHGAD
jgi:predicted small secreted protein